MTIGPSIGYRAAIVGMLFDTIRQLVLNDRYLVSEHAAARLEERRILEWQVVAGIAEGDPLDERPQDQPHPSVVVRQLLADGTEVKVVWSHIKAIDVAKLVTVHFIDP